MRWKWLHGVACAVALSTSTYVCARTDMQRLATAVPAPLYVRQRYSAGVDVLTVVLDPGMTVSLLRLNNNATFASLRLSRDTMVHSKYSLCTH